MPEPGVSPVCLFFRARRSSRLPWDSVSSTTNSSSARHSTLRTSLLCLPRSRLLNFSATYKVRAFDSFIATDQSIASKKTIPINQMTDFAIFYKLPLLFLVTYGIQESKILPTQLTHDTDKCAAKDSPLAFFNYCVSASKSWRFLFCLVIETTEELTETRLSRI